MKDVRNKIKDLVKANGGGGVSLFHGQFEQGSLKVCRAFKEEKMA